MKEFGSPNNSQLGSNNIISNLVDILSNKREKQPNKIAYTFLNDGETEELNITYQELDQRARACAATLQSLDLFGERALLLYPPGLEFIVAFLGCLYAGVVAVPAYPPQRRNQKMSRLQTIINDVEAKVSLTTTSVLGTMEERFAENTKLPKLRWLNTDKIQSNIASDWQKPIVRYDTLAFIQYTSGSTVTPKGVMVTHGNIIYNQKMIELAFQHDRTTIFVGWLPLFHDMGLIGNVLQPLYLGIPSILMSPTAFMQKPIRWLQNISRYHATTSGAPNFAYDLCVNRISSQQKEILDLSSWKVAFNGSEPIRAETLQRFSEAFAECGFRPEAFYPCYGMAETTLLVSGGIPNSEPVLKHVQASGLEKNQIVPLEKPKKGTRTIVGCGRTILEQDIIIVDLNSQVKCSSEQIGEIWISGKNVAKGYWNREVETQKNFGAYLSDTDKRSYLRTGDLGFIDQKGELFVTGRLKEIIIIRGRNYYPQDIELVAQKSHPALRPNSGAAFSLEIEGQERLIIAHEVERSYLRRLNISEISSAIRRAVSEEFEIQLNTVLLLKTHSILKTSSGKIQRLGCRSAFLNGTLNVVGHDELKSSTDSQPASSETKSKDNLDLRKPVLTEKVIANWLVSHLALYLGLQADEIDLTEPFAHYGMDSSVAVSTTGELAEWLECELEPTLFWEYPSIEEVAKYLAVEFHS